ncbi:GDP-mannose 4,6-dehydratase [Eubacteriales bacterium OttesenSCG-928-N13]|nr:GDP-mannose 4,6-dehydratase [Eubacteriales bacterium OttesenSCG-928-N13]
MRVMVTGGAGFIGSQLSKQLIARGDQVLAIDNFNDFYDPALKRNNVREIEQLDHHSRFQLAEIDIRDAQALEAAFSSFKPDAVVHLAAYAGVRPSIENPALYGDVNLMGTIRLLEAMNRFGVKRLAFASSSSVYGSNKKVPFSESDAVDHPISPYAATKKAGELITHTYHALHGFSVACLRFFTVYGPSQRPDLAICKFCTMIERGEPIPVFGDGSTMRDYTYIDDILDGVTKALDWTAGEPKYDIFNLGESHTVTLTEMIETIEQEMGQKAVIRRMPMQPGDVEKTYADISHSKDVLGYNPTTPFKEGIRKYIAWRKGIKHD